MPLDLPFSGPQFGRRRDAPGPQAMRRKGLWVEAYAIGVVFDDQGYRMRREAVFREGIVAHTGE
jgi:hypothetical protein